jgi:proteic killer suppression protein
MIRSFKHKGLEKFFTKGTASGIQSAHSKRLGLILGRLSASTTPQDMDLPGLYLHQLRGKFRGRWSVRVSGNWRVTFKFEGLDAIDIDYEDYH